VNPEGECRLTRNEPRAAALLQALLVLAPRIPPEEAAAVVDHALWSKGLRRGSPQAAAWLSLVSHVRHSHTDYDALLREGYGPEAARHFSVEPINAVLAAWGSRRRVEAEAEVEDGAAED
jgi:hypothetical protein